MNNKGSCRPGPKSGRLARRVFVSIALVAAAGCGGGEGQPPSSTQIVGDAYEGPNGDNTPASAHPLAIGSAQSRTLFPAGDEDYVKLTLVAGRQYELSSNRLNYTGDTQLSLYDEKGIAQPSDNPAEEKEDYIDLDSRILFTPTTSGTYYLKVEGPNVPGTPGDTASYTLSARVFTDGDGDTYSPYYDCNDADKDIHPWALERPGDGIDQDCTGADVPRGDTADIAEDDDTIPTARVMAPIVHSPWEPLFERAMYLTNTRSLTPGDVDYFSVEIPAHGLVLIDTAFEDFNLVLVGSWFGSDSTVPVEGPDTRPLFYVANIEDKPKTIHVKFEAGVDNQGVLTTGYYVPYYVSLGVDMDGDRFYTQDWIGLRDCNDADRSVYPGAADAAGDGVDQNCNGRDG